ncbi:MAG: ATP-binding cassette domain-containing protein [Chitinispirillia bacterium]|nr:ATP-binding cassette domain-containing protein [Chitinispirillia bacterium]MCL2242522.1 ATP-binding cassette domain-containing protein [Chitinispirillia bacterium]
MNPAAQPHPAAQAALPFESSGSGGAALRIGRDTANDVCLPHPMVSRFHAVVKSTSGGFVITDQGSTNSTYVNGAAVGTAQLAEGDVVHVGPFRFYVSGGEFRRADGVNRIRIEAQGVGVRLRGKKLLEGVNLTIEPGAFVALLGPSGAGKSTLSRVLSGQLAPTSGRLLMNGLPAGKYGAAFARGMGYVSQQILLRPELTVWETLTDQSLIRLPIDSTVDERLTRAGEVLELMGLTAQRDRRVANLSGGEARRLHVGVELLASPAVVILDEPLAGLDPGLIGKFMQLFRRISDKGYTLILITHTLEQIDLCDRVVYIAKSRVDQAGRVFFSGAPSDICGHFGVACIADIYDKAGASGPEDGFGADAAEPMWQSTAPTRLGMPALPVPGQGGAESAHSEEPVHPGEMPADGSTHTDEHSIHTGPNRRRRDRHGPGDQYQNSQGGRQNQQQGDLAFALRHPLLWITLLIRQTCVLTARYSKVYIRDKRNMLLLMAQTPLITLLLGLVYKTSILQFDVSFYFCLTVTGIWVGGLDAVREVAAELPLLAREAKCGMRRLSYIAARITAAAALSAVQALIFAVSAVVIFRNLVFTMELLILLFAAVFSGNLLGLAVSACSGGVSRAISTLPIVLIPQIFFSGILVKFEHMTELGRQISHLTVSRPVFSVMKKVFCLDREIFWHTDWTELFLLCAALIIILWIALKCRTGRRSSA